MSVSAAMFAEAAALLIKQPRSAMDIARLMDCKPDTIYKYLGHLKDEGLVYVSGWQTASNGGIAAIYTWQPAICAMQDAPRPTYQERTRRGTCG